MLKATFLAGGLEEMDLEEILSLAGGNAVARMPGVVIASAAQGAVNAFATARVGVVTKSVLFAEGEPIDMRRLRRESYGEALSPQGDCDQGRSGRIGQADVGPDASRLVRPSAILARRAQAASFFRAIRRFGRRGVRALGLWSRTAIWARFRSASLSCATMSYRYA